MAKVTLRFYGRFVHAVSKRAGLIEKIRVLAPRFNPEPFGRHQVHMTARRDALVFRDLVTGKLLTSVHPAFKAVTDKAIEESEVLVWDLAGMTVTYGISGEVTLAGEEILDLREVEDLAGRPVPQLDASAFKVDAQGKSSAIIDVSAGAGTAKKMPTAGAEYRLVTETDARDGDPDNDRLKERPPGTVIRKKLADVVDFDVPLPASQGRLTLTLTDSTGKQGIVTVNGGATVSFSNLCVPLPRQQTYDLEFTRYYDLLKEPRDSKQLVPRDAPTPHLGEGVDCYLQAQIEHDPVRG